MFTSQNTKIKISSAQSNQRIDKFLACFCVEKSRAGWQKMIKNEEVLVNDKNIKADYILKNGDELVISNEAKRSEKSINLAISTLSDFSPKARNDNFRTVIPNIEIIYENNDVIVIDKPAGILSQKAESSKAPAVSDFLVKYCPKIKEVGKDERTK